MKKRGQKELSAIALWVAMGLVLLGWGSVWAAPPEGVLKQAIHWNISADWLDPATSGFSTSAYAPMYLFHDALLKQMPSGMYTPCLAESWTVSPDSKIYEFKLRPEVKFHNGDVVTAEDVAFSFERYKAAQAKTLHDRTEKVEVVNPTLVRFHFKKPFPDFLEFFLYGSTTIGWVVPKKYLEKVGDAGFKKNPIGCGPYKLVEFTPGVKLVAEAFEGFWRKVPSIKRIELTYVPEASTRVGMVRKGDVDIGTLITDVLYEDLKRDPKGLKLYTPLSPTQRLAYIASQWDPKSPWSDPRVRKAASLAIDRKSVADIHSPGSDSLGGLGPKGDPLAVEFPPDPYDPQQAKKILAEAGYPKGFHGGKYYPFDSGYLPYGEQIANYWKAIGISLDTIILERAAWGAMRDGGKMKDSIFIDLTTAPTIGGQLSYLLGSGAYGNYPDIKTLWDQYQNEANLATRKNLIARVQRMIQERTMWIPLTGTSSPAAIGPRVKGNPYKIPLVWFTSPFEDIELREKINTMNQEDYYQVLGVEKSAAQQTIKEAYRKLAFQYHPDRNRGNVDALEIMKRVNEAYAILSDPRKRKEYDTLSREYGPSAYDRFRQSHSEEDIFRGSDINQVFEEMARAFGFRGFEEIFRESYGQRYQTFEFRRPGFFGKGFIFVGPGFRGKWNRPDRPEVSSSSGPSSGGSLSSLSGKWTRYLLKKMLLLKQAERGKDWQDEIILDPGQARMGGKGRYIHRRRSRELLVTIPPGIREGQKIRLKGMGGKGKDGGDPGDLYLRVHFRKPLIQRIRNSLKI